MAWEWSHTPEAYAHAEREIDTLPTKVVATIWAEWKAHTVGEYFDGGFDERVYGREFRRAWSLMRRGFQDRLRDDIKRLMAEQELCTSGGWEAWACPFGCGCHTVSFGPDAS